MQDGDGELFPVTREELVRVWVWQKGRLHSQLVLASDQAEVICEKQQNGWHAWVTPAVMFKRH